MSSSGNSSASSSRPSSPILFKSSALPCIGFYSSTDESRVWAPLSPSRPPSSSFAEFAFDDAQKDLAKTQEDSSSSTSSSPAPIKKAAGSPVSSFPPNLASSTPLIEQDTWLEDRAMMMPILIRVSHNCPACLPILTETIKAITFGEGFLRSLSATGAPEDTKAQARIVRAKQVTEFYAIARHCTYAHQH